MTDEDARPDGFATAAELRAEIALLYAQQLTAGHKAYRVVFHIEEGLGDRGLDTAANPLSNPQSLITLDYSCSRSNNVWAMACGSRTMTTASQPKMNPPVLIRLTPRGFRFTSTRASAAASADSNRRQPA